MGTTSEHLLKLHTANPAAVFRLHLCTTGCNQQEVSDQLIHARRIRQVLSVDQEEGWVTNLEKVRPLEGGDDLGALRPRGLALGGTGVDFDNKDKKKKDKPKKEKKKNKEKKEEKTGREKEEKDVESSSASGVISPQWDYGQTGQQEEAQPAVHGDRPGLEREGSTSCGPPCKTSHEEEIEERQQLKRPKQFRDFQRGAQTLRRRRRSFSRRPRSSSWPRGFREPWHARLCHR